MIVRETWLGAKPTTVNEPRRTKAVAQNQKHRFTANAVTKTTSIEASRIPETPFTRDVLIRGSNYGVTDAEWNALHKAAASKKVHVEDFINQQTWNKDNTESMAKALRKATVRFLPTSLSSFQLPRIIYRDKFGKPC